MPTPIAETEFRNKVSEILKKVDSLIKSEDLGRAREEILHAKTIDPRNMYAHAYLERVDMLLEQQQRNREAAEARKLAEEAARIKAEQERKRREKEEAERRKAFEEERRKLEAERKRRDEDEERKRNHVQEISLYNNALFEAWSNGVPAEQQQQRLDTLRISLHISDGEHTSLESAVRRECYTQAFRRLWASDRGITDGPATITNLRRQYHINPGEYDSIEVELLTRLKKQAGPLIVVIDDDQEMLNILDSMLLEGGYDPRGFTTSDEAYRFLMHTTPELILSDVNLETSTLGGFAFYEQIQELPHLMHVPFIFMSGITDDIIIRTGKEMGVDDYLPKPFDDEKLLSVVKGKIRRYRELRRIASN